MLRTVFPELFFLFTAFRSAPVRTGNDFSIWKVSCWCHSQSDIERGEFLSPVFHIDSIAFVHAHTPARRLHQTKFFLFGNARIKAIVVLSCSPPLEQGRAANQKGSEPWQRSDRPWSHPMDGEPSLAPPPLPLVLLQKPSR